MAIWPEKVEIIARDLNDHYAVCDDCGAGCIVGNPSTHRSEWIGLRAGYETNSGAICEHCVSFCDSCGEPCSQHTLEAVGEQAWCEACIERYAARCRWCDEWYNEEEMHVVNRIGLVCEECVNHYMGTCVHCGELWDMNELDEDGRCPDCADEPGCVHPYGYKPAPQFKGTGPLFYGIELEVETDGPVDVYAITGEEEYLYAKHDGSLDDGVEFVSHPASLEWIREQGLKEWNKVFALRKDGCRSWDAQTCGMHVHLSADAFSTWHLYKMLRFFTDNAAFVTYVSGRDPRLLERWASLSPMNDYTLVYKAKNKKSGTRYVALNCTGKTIECRIFRGTLRPERFMANLEFLQALYDYTRDAGLADLTVSKFTEFVRKNKKQYKAFWNKHGHNL